MFMRGAKKLVGIFFLLFSCTVEQNVFIKISFQVRLHYVFEESKSLKYDILCTDQYASFDIENISMNPNTASSAS
jgi:hypothetical protein